MHPFDRESSPRFRPSPIGCVGKDPALAGAVAICCMDALGSVSADICRSLTVEQEDRDLSSLYDRIAEEELGQFRRLGQLTLALGGNPPLRILRSQDSARIFRRRELARQFCLPETSLSEHRRNSEHCRIIASRSKDPVVRSFLSGILDTEERILSSLSEFRRG